MDLDQLAALSHPERTRRLVALGRAAAGGDPTARAAITALTEAPEAWTRWLGQAALAASGDTDALVAALNDPARSVRLRAWSTLAARGALPAVAEALKGRGHSRAGARLAAEVMRKRPNEAVERVILGFADRDHAPWLDRLGVCRPETLRAALPRLDEHGSAPGWRRAARANPEVIRDHFVAALRADKQADSRLLWRIETTVPELIDRAPDAALDVISALFDQSAPPHPLHGWLKRLARLRPARTFDILRERQRKGLPAPRPGLFSMVHFPNPIPLGRDRIAWLLVHGPGSLPDDAEGRAWVQRLSEEDHTALCGVWLTEGVSSWGAFMFGQVDPADPRRGPAFDRWRRAASDTHGRIHVRRLEQLPRDLREHEARRHLNELDYLQARPLERREYARLLGFAEAQTVLDPWLRHPEGTERAVALGLLLATPRFDANGTDAALGAVRRRKNEQDPVRQAMLSALAALPPGRLVPHIESVVAIIDEALDAADLSGGTAHQAQRLAALVLAHTPTLGLAVMERLLRVRGSLDGAMIGARLTPADAARLDLVLAAVLADWIQQERAGAAIGLLRGLGQRLRHMPATVAAMEALCEIPSLPALAGLLDLLAEWAPRRFGARALALFDADPSVVALPSVARHIATVATDRLDPLLDGQPMTGRWATGRTHWVLDFGLDFGGWTAAQQTRYGQSLTTLVDDPDQAVPTCRWAIERLAALTWAPPEPIVRLTSDPRQPIREIAIRAAPYADDGSGLPALLDCMGDDRARVATYALRAILKEMPPAEVLARLSRVPMERVTVAKEVLRLMGELGGPGARPALVEIGRRTLHRDVRIALLRALWDHIEHPDAWALLEAAATDPDPILARRLFAIPLERLSVAADARLCALFAQVLARKEIEARLGFIDDVGAAPVRDHGRTLLQALLRHLGTPDPTESAAAFGAVLARMRLEEAPVVVARVAGLLSNRPHAAALLERLIGATSHWSPPPVRAVASAVCTTVGNDRLAATWAVRLAPRTMDTRGFVAMLESLDARGHIHHDAVQAAMAAVREVASPLTVANLLSAADAPRLRRIALAALLEAASPQNGWTAELRALLVRMQADPSVEVAAPAAWVFPPPAKS